jgi:hypothetical protein
VKRRGGSEAPALRMKKRRVMRRFAFQRDFRVSTARQRASCVAAVR